MNILPKTFLSIILFVIVLPKVSFAEISLSGDMIHHSSVLTDKGLNEKYRSGSFIKSVSRLQLKFDRNDEDNFSLHGEFWAMENHLDDPEIVLAASEGENNSDVLLREAYISGRFGALEFNIGKMILNWGRADYINPVDIVNPEDFSEFYTLEKMEIKIPVLLFNGRFFYNNFTFDIVWIPFFENSIFPTSGPWTPKEICGIGQFMAGNPYRIDLGVKKNADQLNTDHSEIAFRATTITDFIDFGFVYFSGYNDQGGIKLSVDDKSTILFESVYHRYNGIGCDFAIMLKGYGIRGEFFYRDEIPQPVISKLGLQNVLTSDFQGIIGVDKSYGDNLYINCQYIYKKINDYNSQMIAEEDESILTFLIENKFYYEQLKTAAKVFYGTEKSDIVFNPFCEYLMTDNFKAELGAYIFDGSKETFFGQYDLNDHVYMRLEYAF